MGWAEQTDRALQTIVNAFKTVSTYSPVVGAPYTLNGVFQRPGQGVDPDTGAIVSMTHSTFMVRQADMSAEVAKGDMLTIGSIVYRVIDSEADGEGGSLLTLHQQG